eukprot:6192078-Pleurochrysis_carterae.AAC.1
MLAVTNGALEYYWRHSPGNQPLVAHTGSATGLDHSLHAPVVCKVLSNVHGHVGQIKGSLRGSIQGVWRGCMPPTLLFEVLLSYSPPSMPGKTVNGQKGCILSLAAKAKQGSAVLLGDDAARWLREDARRVTLALGVLGLYGAVGDQLLDLEVVGEVDCAGAVYAQLSRTWRRKARQFGHQATQVDCLTCSKGVRHDIGLTRGQRKGLLLLHAPGYRRIGQHKAVARVGAACLKQPITVSISDWTK